MTERTGHLTAAQRVGWWGEQAAGDAAPPPVGSPGTADFRAVVLAELGPVQLSVLSFPDGRAARLPALIRHGDAERYGLSLITSNALLFAQRGHECRVSQGDLLLLDAAQPWQCRPLPGGGPGGMLTLHLPKTALPLRAQRLNRLLARRLPADGGMRGILARYLSAVATAVQQGEVDEPETARLGEVALGLAAAALAAEVETRDHLSPQPRRQAFLARIEAFVEHNLADPELGPAAIAAHHHISLGYLHRLFQQRELTVRAWIRHRRIERARADLADPRLSHHPVHAIAARWGFRHPADFSRAFRATHGISPSDYRRRALATGCAADPVPGGAAIGDSPLP